jgi:predicted alpha/beta hydrolase
MSMDIVEAPRALSGRDGYGLAATIYRPAEPKAAVLISSATGVPQGLYKRLARYGAERGFACLTYDYRGMAESAPREMRTSPIDIMDWARLDFPAALDEAASLARGKPLYTIGHSVGGHLLGFAENWEKSRANAFLCTGTGYWGAHHPSYMPMALFFWWIYGPACLALKGHIPAGGLWGGEALPPQIFRQWRRWAQYPDYFGAELDSLKPHYFNEITRPIRNWGFTDDTLASPRSQADLMKLYTAAAQETVRKAPAEYGLKSIGHAGAFRKGCEPVWAEVFDWLESV